MPHRRDRTSPAAARPRPARWRIPALLALVSIAGVVALASGIGLLGDVHMPWSTDGTGRPMPDRATVAAPATPLQQAASRPAAGALPLELSYVDPESPASTRLKAWLTGATQVSARQLADVPLDFSRVDRASPGYAQFKAWVDRAVSGRPAPGFPAADAAVMFRLTAEQKYCDLAVDMLGRHIGERAAAGARPVAAGAPLSDLALTLSTCARTLNGPQRDQWLAYAGEELNRPAPEPQRLSQAMLADIPLALSYVDRTSPAYTRFKSWVDSAVNGSPGYAFEAVDAAIMFRLTGEKKYCDLAVRMSEQQVADAEAVIAGGGRPAVSGDSYLEVGTMISDLALTLDTCYRDITPPQQQRWSSYAEQAVWNVWNHDSAQWGGRSHPWSGWSVDNPGNNYYYSFLEATMYWGLAYGRRQNWVTFLRDQKLPPLQTYFSQLPGGGSREGTGYGAAFMRLFSLYRIWRNATGVDLANANPHVTDSISYWAHATVPTLDRFAPIGDQSRNPVPELYDYHRRLILEARQLTQAARAKEIAAWWLGNISVPRMSSGFNFRHDLLPAGTGGSPPTELLYHARGTGLLFARSGWDRDAMWLSFIAGPYNESHAHQDQGSFTLFARDWLAVTENIWSHSGIQQGTDVHNLVRFERSNPSASQCTSPTGDRIVHQCEPSTSSMTVTPNGPNGAFTATANLTPAYRGNPALVSWTRRLDFAARKLTVRDAFQLGAGTTAFFQVNTPAQPVVSGRTATAGRLRVTVLEPANATLSVRSWNAVNAGEFNTGWRIDVAGGTTGYLVELTEI